MVEHIIDIDKAVSAPRFYCACSLISWAEYMLPNDRVCYRP